MDNYAGFIIKEGDFSGIDRLADNVRQDNAQKQAQKDAEIRRAQANKVASMKYLNDLTDREQFMTGAPQDDFTIKNLNKYYRR